MQSTYLHYRYRSVTADPIRWRGYWITSERFYHLPACRQYGHDRLPQFNSEIQNIHTMFRKQFSLADKAIQKALLYVSSFCFTTPMQGPGNKLKDRETLP